MSSPWFTDSSAAPNRPPRRSGFSYVPPHLRTQPNITITIPSHSNNVPRWRRRVGLGVGGPIPVPVSQNLEQLEGGEKDEPLVESVGDAVVEASGRDVPPPVASFAEMDFLAEALIDNIKRCKYVTPTPIQRHAIPVAMAGRDLMACAQTGSGKTAAFCFPIINGVMVDKQKPSKGSGYGGLRRGLALPVALILAPTRELACQIHEEAKKFSRQTGVQVAVAYGGTPIVQQLRTLEKGVDILVATPGRLVDMIERSRVSLRSVKYLALDEADRMLDMGFEPQIRKIVQQMEMPPPGERQTMLFSATFPTEIQRMASDFLSNYIFLAAGKVGSSTDLISQRVEFVPDMDKRNYLVNLLRAQRANGVTAKDTLTLVFVETKKGADSLESWLSRKGFPATAIHGDKMQMERERALKSFRNGRTPILVATDVAARGLDIPHVAHVINFDLPRAVDDYVHRIGRTGRAGKSGLATAFFSEKNVPLANALVKLMQEANQDIPEWLKEYAATSYNGGGFARPPRNYSGRQSRTGSYNDDNNDNYSSQFTGADSSYTGADSSYTDYSDLVTTTGDDYAIASSYMRKNGEFCDPPPVSSFPYGDAPAADPLNGGCSYGSVVATGWE